MVLRVAGLRPSPERSLAALEEVRRWVPPTRLTLEDDLSRLLGTKVYVKHEYESPVRSFKIRGALNLVADLVSDPGISRLFTVSTGNHGAAMAYACRQYGMALTVVAPLGADESKVALIREFGADLELLGRDLDEGKELLLARDFEPGHRFIEDGKSARIVEGTSTIGLELATQQPDLEAVFVPVGNGALIGGLASSLKAANPAVQIIGVQSAEAPCMALSFANGRPTDTATAETFAGGMAVRVAIPEAVELMLEVVDRMVLVSETELKRSMRLFQEVTGTLPEGAGAAALAAALKLRRQSKAGEPCSWDSVCLIASGANVDSKLAREVESLSF